MCWASVARCGYIGAGYPAGAAESRADGEGWGLGAVAVTIAPVYGGTSGAGSGRDASPSRLPDLSARRECRQRPAGDLAADRQ
ncbi:hypothetical protein GCM10010193_35490 [Kitasatospora atroaurantiaca]